MDVMPTIHLEVREGATLQAQSYFGAVHANASDCPPAIGGRPLSFHQGQSCLYGASTNWINVNADAMELAFRHQPVKTSQHAGRALDCVVRRHRDHSHTNLHTMRKGYAAASLTQWLAWAGVDLEKVGSLQAAAAAADLTADDAAAATRQRLTGLGLAIHVEYYNWGLTQGARLSNDYMCVIEVCALPLTSASSAVGTPRTYVATPRHGAGGAATYGNVACTAHALGHLVPCRHTAQHSRWA